MSWLVSLGMTQKIDDLEGKFKETLDLDIKTTEELGELYQKYMWNV